MKLLTGLAIAQFVLIGFLFVRVLGLEEAIERPVAVSPPTNSEWPAPSIAPSAHTSAPAAAIDEQRLRAIIREELASAGHASKSEPPGTAAEIDPQKEIEYDYKLEEVRQTLDFYAQTGQVSQEEMGRLQSDIAKLRPGDREAMLRRLVRELNSGSLEGRL